MRAFVESESGAVTVDWVVLTAALVGLGIASVAAVRTGTSSLASSIQTSLSDASLAELGVLGTDRLAARLETYSDNFLRLHWHWWEAHRGGGTYSDEQIDRNQAAGLAEMASRNIDMDPPTGSTTCGNLGSTSCWNDLSRGW